MKKFLKNNWVFVIIFIFLAVYFLSMAFMISWGLMTSVKDPFEYSYNKTGFPEEGWYFSNYVKAFKSIKVGVYKNTQTVKIPEMYLNTILYAGGCAFLSTLVSCVVAYMCAKFRYTLSAVVVTVVLVTMSLPIVGSTPAALQLASLLGIYDTIWGMWIMSAHFQTGIHFLVFYDAFCGIPDAYMEAAEIDGASEFSVMTRIMIPLAKNIFATVFLLRLIGLWNDYQTPLLYIPDKPTIAYGLFYFTKINTSNDTFSVPMQLTGAFLVLLPVLIVFCFFQSRIMTNLSVGGIKG